MSRKSVLERAFELALTGPASSIDEIRKALKAEGFTDALAQTSYPTIRKQLRAAIHKRLVGEGTDAAALPRRMTGALHLSV